MKKIAILYLGNYYYDAHLINMTMSLSNNNYAVDVFCVQEPSAKKLTHGLQNIRIVPIRLQCCGILKYIEFIIRGRQKLNIEKYHCIIAGDVYSLATACNLAYRPKLIYDCREIYSELAAHINKPIHKCLVSMYENYFIKFYSHVIITAKTDALLLKAKFKKHQHLTWHLLYNFPLYQKLVKTINLRNEYQIPSKHTIICYQGVIQKGRGLEKLFINLQKNTTLWACIVGDGESRYYYEALAKKLIISNRVLFVGRVPYLDLLQYTSACDIGWAVIQSAGVSNRFALPNKLFEYGLANIPVIASKLPNLIKIITNYKLGILVDSKDIVEQMSAIKKLQNRKKTSEYKQIIKNNFHWDIQAKKFLDIINGK